jgi:hypothetical protein
MTVVASKGVIATLQTAVTTGTGTAVVLPISAHNPRIHMCAVGVITGGTVVLEEARDPNYTGTWSILYTYTPATDSELVIHINGTLGALRTRVTSNIIGGGVITAELVSD